MRTNYKHQFEKAPAKKGICPSCNHKCEFRYYEGLPREFGKCERVNNCGYHKKPDGSLSNDDIVSVEMPLPKTIYPDPDTCKQVINNQSSNFHKFISNSKLNIPIDHLIKWNVGSRFKERYKIIETAFVYQNVDQQYVNVRYFEYSNLGKRNKAKHPYSLKVFDKNSRFTFCLFGEHLLSPDKIICLVESEKTAVIASYFYPNFDWLASGGANGLTDEKISVLFNREVYYLNDSDSAGLKNSTLDKLKSYEINFKQISLFPDRTEGYDLADSIIDGEMPKIKPTSETKSLEYNPTPVKQVSDKKISQFERVEKYLLKQLVFRYNEVSNEVEIRDKGEVQFKKLKENNIYRLLKYNHFNFSKADLSALMGSDFVPTYNPFNDYFEGLPIWKKETGIDYIDMLSNYIVAKDQQRFKIQLKKMLVRCIACSLLPNVFNKHAFILVHEKQGTGKTSFLRWLCPPALKEYYTETFILGKDGEMSLSDNMFINLDELSTLSKHDIDVLKSCFSRLTIRQRRPFDRTMTNLPRRANFWGSTNKSEFLTDESGSVRWLCFEIENIIWSYDKDIDINQIWSQAYSLFKSGFKYELTTDEITQNELANSTYQIRTQEIELIEKHFSPATKDNHQTFCTASDIHHHLSDKYKQARLNTNNIGKAMKFLGHTKSQKYNGAYPIKGYYLNYIISLL